MWLLDTESLELVSFDNEEQTPYYAILSHTWSDEEVSFQDAKTLPTTRHRIGKPGWSKVENACRLALSLRFHYIWIDTCCIDKSSSAELQEAINSMFRWYEKAGKCFAYLSDVSASEDPTIVGSSFRCSRWFKRGWTLQELIAPQEVSFYDKDWEPISARHPMCSIMSVVQEITGIRDLSEFNDDRIDGVYEILSTRSVAERMSWMNGRETQRPEDLAYCLLGIFDINMPMLYGEGNKAFQRLQEEIMKNSDDSTLLSWDYEDSYNCWDFQDDSLLAPSPSCFRGCREFESCHLKGFDTASFSMNQKGLQMEVPVRVDPTHQLLVYMILGCSPRSKEKDIYWLENQSYIGHKELPWKKKASLETEYCLEKKIHKYFVAIPLISTSAYGVFAPHQKTQKGEYFRPRWCRPVLISEKFLAQTQSTSIVIRRPSGQYFRLEHLPISIRLPPIPITQGFTVLAIYPPQPISIRYELTLVSLLAGSPQRSADPTGYILPPQPKRRTRWHQIMIYINFQEFGNLIIVLEYQLEFQGQRGSDEYIINCRVFNTPESCDLEGLQRLSVTQDFTHLRKVDSVSQEDGYMLKIGITADKYLVIHMTGNDDWTHITDVDISVTRPSDKCDDEDGDDKQ